jgi:sec-independent protein translocase protein TatB
MSFSETIFLFVLALVIFGPKKLPEIARQAGRLLAELRRASNEFKSQIETEIAHLEVEQKQAILPPADPPQGAIASLSLNPAASEAAAHESGATLAAPAEAPVANSTSISNPANTTEPSLGSDSATLVSSTSEPAASPAAQDSHV